MAEALPPLEQAIRIEPSKQLYRNNIAKVMIEMNHLDGAMQNLASVHPPAIANYNMGVLLHERKREQEAISYLVTAQQIDPAFQPAGALLAELSTPATPQSSGTQLATGNAPATSSITVSPEFKTMPAETAQRPVGYGPTMVAPVR